MSTFNTEWNDRHDQNDTIKFGRIESLNRIAIIIIRKDTQKIISTTLLPHILSLQIYAQKQKFHVPTLQSQGGPLTIREAPHANFLLKLWR